MKKFLTAFVTICIALCFIPLLAMTFRPTTESTENRALSEFPKMTTAEGKVNLAFFQQFEKYFSEHFAFRNELVYADSRIQSDIFKSSGVDSVVNGKNGWLYYKSTLNDYLGKDVMSERELYNLAHNISLVNKYLEIRGKKFLFTVPPNKNTLYGDNMPYYYSYKVEDRHNIDSLAEVLGEAGVPYADLLQLFKNQEEILYLKRDSHWNNKGALLAYNLIMDSIGQSHDDYSGVTPNRSMDALGDLSKMVYTFYGEKELNYNYEIDEKASYRGEFKSVEDGFIETEGGKNPETLLMFRDSFGNTLIPFVKEQYSKVWFAKGVPHSVERLLEEHNPDQVIFEKVERNIGEFITTPPIISAPAFDGRIEGEEPVETGATLEFGNLSSDYNYYRVKGEIPSEYLGVKSNIIIDIDGKKYSGFHIGENGYEMYIKKERLESFPVSVKIIVIDEGKNSLVVSKVFNEGDVL